MRIIGGTAGGRILKVPRGYDVRPTPDLVRQAIFNSLGDRVRGTRVLELFAGTGALALECLSRGASYAVCVEKTNRHAQVIRQNLASCELDPGSMEVRIQDVFTVLHQLREVPRQFELILADPPYGKKNIGQRSTSLAQKLIDDPNLPFLLAPDGRLILGHARRDTLDLHSRWQELKQLKHGDSLIRFLTAEAGTIGP
jgi:16S rRNA (guanine966-N2)-methyltransferase